jgi:hypothetical protein
MNSDKKTATILEDMKINVKIKLSAFWITVNLLYIYVDVYSYYIPGEIEKIIAGEVAFTGIEVTQAFLLVVIILMTIPSIMVFLSLILPAKANRWTNISVGVFEIIFVAGGVIGETWAFYIFGSIVEVVLLSLIVWYAWKWPKHERAESHYRLGTLEHSNK